MCLSHALFVIVVVELAQCLKASLWVVEYNRGVGYPVEHGSLNHGVMYHVTENNARFIKA